MTRFNLHGTAKAVPNHGRFEGSDEKEGTWSIAYGFDRIDGIYFIQGYFDCPEEGVDMTPDYWDGGGKTEIMESPFWEMIMFWREDHATQIALDLQPPKDTIDILDELTKKYLAFDEGDERRVWMLNMIEQTPKDKLMNPEWKNLI